MRRIAAVLGAIVLALAAPVSSARAAEFRSGDDVVIGANEIIDDDVYLTGSTIRILGTVRGDVFAAGNTILVDGVIEGSLNAAANTIRVNGRVDRTVRAAANDLTLGNTIGRDLFAAGANVQFLSTAKTGGDAIIAAAAAVISGKVGRDLRGGASTLRIEGSVGRNVALGEVETLEIGREAVIGGSLQYTSPRDATVGQGARITGDRSRQQPTRPETQPAQPLAGVFAYLWSAIRSFLGLVALGLLWLWFLPGAASRTLKTLVGSPLPSIGTGLAALLIAPAAIVLLIVLALLFGMGQLLTVATSALAIGVAMAGVVVSQEIGDRLLAYAKRDTSRHWVGLLLGAAILASVGSLPIIGWLVNAVVLVAGAGALLLTILQLRRGPAPFAPAATPMPPLSTAPQAL